jgi:hypothetical protein
MQNTKFRAVYHGNVIKTMLAVSVKIMLFPFSNSFEIFLRSSAERTYPIGRKIFKIGSFRYTVIRIAYFGVIFISAKFANVKHSLSLL